MPTVKIELQIGRDKQTLIKIRDVTDKQQVISIIASQF